MNLWEKPLLELQQRVEALEARLAEAKPKAKRRSEPTGVPSPAAFYRILSGAGKVLPDAIDPETFGVIGRKFAKSGVVPEDVQKFQVWVDSGGLNWVKEPFVWNSICRAPKYMLLDWIARAKAYSAEDRKPPQQLSFNFDNLLDSMRATHKDAP